MSNTQIIEELDKMIKRLVELGMKDAAYAVRVESDKFRSEWKRCW
jgi:hypothetical protein